MNKEKQLLSVKQRIIDNLVPLVIDGQGEPSERAESILALIELGNASPAMYEKGLEVITHIEDPILKTDLLMRLLGSVQLDLSGDDTEPATPVEEDASAPESEPQDQQDDQDTQESSEYQG